MRILHLNLSLSGIGRYGLLFGEALHDVAGADVLSVFNEHMLRIDLLRARADRFPHRTLPWAGSVRDRLRALRQLTHLLAEFRPDVIHDTAGSSAKNVVLWPLLGRHAPMVVTEHDPLKHQGWISVAGRVGERLSRAMRGRFAGHIFVHGPWCRAQLIAEGYAPERVSAIRHGHLGSLFDRGAFTDIRREEREVLFFGEMRPNKGADLLPLIAERVAREVPGVHFTVAGARSRHQPQDPAWRDVDQAVERMKANPYFTVLDGYIPDGEVERLFRQAGLTLMPYREATQSGVAMVAMPLRSVAVATAVGDIPDVIRHGETGFLATPDAESISRTLIDALHNPEQVQAVREAAYTFAIKECDWSTIAWEVLMRYYAVASGTPLVPSVHQDDAGPTPPLPHLNASAS